VPNVVNLLKDEILRLARKEAKAHVGKAQKAVVQYRKQVAELKRQLKQREREIRLLEKRTEQSPIEEDELQGIRFSAKSVRSQRRRLGLSAEQYGKLVGVSALSVYAWERGTSRPRKNQLLALVAVRAISKREALARLER
jgi:DNA-binding transcriptional regulator YiaG